MESPEQVYSKTKNDGEIVNQHIENGEIVIVRKKLKRMKKKKAPSGPKQ